MSTLKLTLLRRRIAEKRRHIRRSLVLVATLALFVVCWLPVNILNLGEDLDLPLRSWRLVVFFDI